MTTLLPETAPVPSPALDVTHPTPCPPWCKHLHERADHHFGPTATWHWSEQATLPNPRPLDGGPSTVMRAELVRGDEDAGAGRTRLYIQAEGDIDLGDDDADMFIVELQAMVGRIQALRRRMG